MHAMTCYITIGNRTFQRCNSIRVKSSRKTLSDTAIVKLANVKTLLDDPNKQINVGDSIEISTGYNGNNTLEFTGYVAEIMPTSPLELRCEDEMWQLKQSEEISKSWKSVKLADVIKYLVSDSNAIQCPDITLSPFRLNRVTKYKAIEIIKEEYGLDIYFRDKKLYAGLAYGEAGKTVKCHFQKNVPGSKLQTGLIYKRKSDIKIKVNAISLTPDNKKIEVNVGDATGELHTLHFYNLTETELKQQAADMIDKLKYDGYRGNLKAFGLPASKHGDVAVLQDENHPERAGSLFIDSVEIEYSPNGYKRTIELGKKASA